MTARLLFASIAVVAASAPALAQVTPSGGGHLFRMKHKTGSRHRYSMKITSTGSKIPGGRQEQSMPFRWDVAKVDKRGEALIDMIFESEKSSLLQDFKMQLKIDAHGKAVDTSTAKPFQRLGVQFPAAPLKVGGTFAASASVEAMGGTAPVKDLYTFRGLKTVDGKRVAVLQVQSKATGKQIRTDGSGTMLIDVSDGYLFRYEYRQKVTATVQGETATIEQTVAVARR